MSVTSQRGIVSLFCEVTLSDKGKQLVQNSRAIICVIFSIYLVDIY